MCRVLFSHSFNTENTTQEFSLIGEFVDMQGNRTSLVSLLVFLRCVQISLGVAGVVGHPQCHRSSSNGNLKTKQEDKQKQTKKLCFILTYL